MRRVFASRSQRWLYNTTSTVQYSVLPPRSGRAASGARDRRSGRRAGRSGEPLHILRQARLSACIISTRDARGRSYQRGRLVPLRFGGTGLGPSIIYNQNHNHNETRFHCSRRIRKFGKASSRTIVVMVIRRPLLCYFSRVIIVVVYRGPARHCTKFTTKLPRPLYPRGPGHSWSWRPHPQATW